MRVFYGAGHEQFTPSELLAHARLAEQAGFDGRVQRPLPAVVGDGPVGARMAWPGAAGAGTARVAIVTAVKRAVARHHRALAARAFARLDQMLPGRVFLGVGSAESLNESPVSCD